jgi:hypothetical protein
LLQITDMYNVIPIESIIELVQVIQRAEKQNEYFVNIQSDLSTANLDIANNMI